MLLSGCDLIFTLKGPPTATEDAPVDMSLPIDGPTCMTATTECYVGGTVTNIACAPTPVATCEAGLFRLCDCGADDIGGILAFPGANPSTETDVVFVTRGSQQFSLGLGPVGGFCPGGPQQQCDIDESACADGNTKVKRWNLSQGPGTFQINIYSGVNPPCNNAPLMTVMVTRD
jgi:hypothetical protein